jgi:bisphosphoglycerate-independent phosphoglycerate mutase (AlkP superfamily)
MLKQGFRCDYLRTLVGPIISEKWALFCEEQSSKPLKYVVYVEYEQDVDVEAIQEPEGAVDRIVDAIRWW